MTRPIRCCFAGTSLRPAGAVRIATSVEVLNRLDADSPVAARARAVIARQTRKLAKMTIELLDVGSLLADDADLLRQPLRLAQVVRGCPQIVHGGIEPLPVRRVEIAATAIGGQVAGVQRRIVGGQPTKKVLARARAQV